MRLKTYLQNNFRTISDTIAANIETSKKITDLKGLGRGVWKNINIEDHIKNEREAWN